MKRTGIKRGTSQLKRSAPLEGGKPLTRTTRLRTQSKKRAKENRERSAMADRLWPGRTPECVVPGCPRLADDLHEPLPRGRGGAIDDPDNAVPVCRPHHDELTFQNPAWGYELELLVHSWDRRPTKAIAQSRNVALANAQADLMREAS
jgi:hypothetical protein